MLRRPHPEGGLGALRVEVRGRRGSARDEYVLGAIDRPGVAAGTVAAMAAVWAAEGRLTTGSAAGAAATRGGGTEVGDTDGLVPGPSVWDGGGAALLTGRVPGRGPPGCIVPAGSV